MSRKRDDADDLFGIFLILGTLGTVFVLWCLFDSGGCSVEAEREQPPVVYSLDDLIGGKS